MQHPVEHRSQRDADADQEYQTGVERIKTGKDLAGIGLRRIDRSHAAEQHGCIQEGIAPGQMLEVGVAGHSQQQREQHQRGGSRDVSPETPQKAAARQQRL